MSKANRTTVHFEDARSLSLAYCGSDANLRRTENSLNVSLVTRENWIQIDGAEPAVDKAKLLFELLACGRKQGIQIRNADFHYVLTSIAEDRSEEIRNLFENPLVLKLRKHTIVPKTLNQNCLLYTSDAADE